MNCPFFFGGGGGGGVVPGDTICNITQFKFCLNLHICNDGSPRIGMGDPTTRLGWSVWRPRILIFQKHCYDKSTLVHVMAWCRQATSHYLNQCWPRSMSPYGVTRPQWVNYWHHIVTYILIHTGSGNTWTNLCWFIISRVQWHSSSDNFHKKYLIHQSLKLAGKSFI